MRKDMSTETSAARRTPHMVLLMLLIIALTAGIGRSFAAPDPLDEGIELLKAKDYRQAFYAFEKLKRTYPGYTQYACYYQAMCYHGMGSVDYARAMLKTTIAVRGGDPYIAESAKQILEVLNKDPAGLKIPDDPRKAIHGLVSNPSFLSSTKEPAHSAAAQYKRDSHGRMVLNVLINSKTYFPMMLDTGATSCFMTEGQAVQAGIDTSKIVHRGESQGIAGIVRTKSYRARLQVGDIYNDVNVKCEEGQATDYALLGRAFFSNLALQVDDRTRTIRFADKQGLQIPASAKKVPFKTDEYGRFIVMAKINDRECPMEFDTGCAGVLFTDKQWSGLGMTTPTNSGKGTSSGVGGSREASFLSIPKMELGGEVKTDVQASVSLHGVNDLPLLGMGFLKGLNYIIDPWTRCIHIYK